MNEIKNTEQLQGSRLVNVFGDKELTYPEQERLADLERTISKNFQAFYVVGCALAEIQANRLYRQTNGTFEEYCRERFEIARSTAYQYLKGAEVVDNVRICGQIGQAPANEAQVRPLVKLSPENQVAAWREVLDTAPDGRVTAKHVSKVVREFLGQQVRKKADALKEEKNTPKQLVSDEFKEAYWALVDVVRSEMMTGSMADKTRKQMVKNLQGLVQLLSD